MAQTTATLHFLTGRFLAATNVRSGLSNTCSRV